MFKDFLVSTPDEKGKITTQTRKTVRVLVNVLCPKFFI